MIATRTLSLPFLTSPSGPQNDIRSFTQRPVDLIHYRSIVLAASGQDIT